MSREELYDTVELEDGTLTKIMKPYVDWVEHLTKEEKTYFSGLEEVEKLQIAVSVDPIEALSRKMEETNG